MSSLTFKSYCWPMPILTLLVLYSVGLRADGALVRGSMVDDAGEVEIANPIMTVFAPDGTIVRREPLSLNPDGSFEVPVGDIEVIEGPIRVLFEAGQKHLVLMQFLSGERLQEISVVMLPRSGPRQLRYLDDGSEIRDVPRFNDLTMDQIMTYKRLYYLLRRHDRANTAEGSLMSEVRDALRQMPDSADFATTGPEGQMLLQEKRELMRLYGIGIRRCVCGTPANGRRQPVGQKFQAGDRAVVTRGGTSLMHGGEEVGTLESGQGVEVLKVVWPWIGVKGTVGDESFQGWVSQDRLETAARR